MPSRSALNQIRSSGPEPRRCGHFAAPNFSCRNDGFVSHGELGMSPGFRSRSLDHTGNAFEAVTLIFLFGNRFVPPRTQSLAAKSPAEGFDESRGRPGKPHKAAFGPRPIWRLVRWFKTTNAHRAQLAALRHKRALKALLGKAAKTTMDFMRRKRHLRSATIYKLLKRAGHAGTQNWERLRRGPRRPLRHSPYYARARSR
jgi:hypothetical protein